MTRLKLKKCPFCRTVNGLVLMECEAQNVLDTEAYAQCEACGARGPSKPTLREAAKAWNSATPDPQEPIAYRWRWPHLNYWHLRAFGTPPEGAVSEPLYAGRQRR